MPSKRKKNKRRMRRVQAQRRVLEEQHSTGAGKGTPGVAAVAPPLEILNCPPLLSPPPVVKVPVVKPPEISNCHPLIPPTIVVKVPLVQPPAPVKVPEAVVTVVEPEVVAAEIEVETPVEAPVEVEVETPEEVPEEVPVEAPEEVPVEAPEEVPVEAPEEVPVEAPEEAPEEVPVEAPEEVPVEAPEEVPVVEAEAPVEPPTEETAAGQEVEESIIPETEPVTEAIPIPEAPVSALAEFKVSNSVAITTEIAQTHDEPWLEAEVEAEIVDEVQAKVEAVVEEEPEPDPMVKAEAAPVGEAELELSGIKDGDSPIVKAGAIPEDIDVEEHETVMTEAPEEVPVETEMIPEKLWKPVEAPIEEAPVAEVAPAELLVEASVDPVINTMADFAITESVPVVEAAMAEQVSAVSTDSLDALSELLNDITLVTEPAPVTADKVIDEPECEEKEVTEMRVRDDVLPPNYRPCSEDLLAKEEIGAQMEIEAKKDAIDEKTVLDVISGDLSAPHPVISELQCHTQLAAPKDIPTEAVLNGQMAAEVAIEG
ncbi:fibrous sheath CABYR-binding protein-like isoform X4 [Oncorhynchus keta]|uniref:fibrous sheath CABYR-binding protein-like isoform X4 n=1 Tax=Oncorhynchus keta TaxID=8018 RepID=UPI00227A36AA|nr:fibrous sheath CABYR-binding protein-like isoform X4 [Oncorhynchus keta]